ncbi:mitochondrial basic amino acids transporter [Sitophilus oryzae]|uniref:Mitochondrial basic amino acids transporter n=1 Tax=Sitophilus oryzae TaxID=7048 RepID=A0A6J2XR09_SITOR|nr:mitochondrial basic amino acids transporter [Sitophilus oryzae]XP_030753271.1 mitochondrial basic amino acids transporter [Sitophilus oryzae]XP_030753272.1 mitochondrial basic amino acids transporter [Sitophilus oryzae]XP_030753273.1 mitochondrial basic amino acids transporter [Sitophilus oryzae]XP_030753274.1 mitochondrial basic amino acids transporter [Sitophilus oryzae]
MALDFFAGCVGGCAGVIVGHPLDTVKVSLQTQDVKNPKYKSTFHCLQTIFVKDGIRGIYRGMSSPLLGVAGINAIVFGIYGNTQRCMKDPDSLTTHMIAGGIAGFVQSFICSPMELAKSRLQVGDKCKDPLDCLKKIYRNEGVKGLFRGLNLTILREVPAFATYFVSYEMLTRRDDNLPISTLTMLTAGGLAGVISWALVYPVDVLKSRYQIDGIKSTKYTSSYNCLVQSIKGEGIGCLFAGLTPTLIRAFPVNAVTFTVVTWTMKLLNDVNLLDKIKDTEYSVGKYTDAMFYNAEHAACMTL